MSAPLPSALRTRFRKYIAEGPSGRAAAARLRVSPATGARWARQIRTRGHADPAVQGRPPGSGKLSPHRAFMEELVAQDPDITLFELRDALAEAEGVEVHHSSIARLLTLLGFTYKKVAGRHRTPPRKGKATARRLVQASPAYDRRLARPRGLPDETAVKTNLTRLRGRTLRGERLTMDAPFGSRGTQTLIAGLTANALIAPWVIRGAMDRPAFAAYVSKVRVPGTVVVLDNLATHRNVEATRALRDHGCWFLHLPPYSPDLNPIEQAFSKLKAHLRRIGARTFTEVFDAIGAICDLFDPQECRNYFTAAGSVSG